MLVFSFIIISMYVLAYLLLISFKYHDFSNSSTTQKFARDAWWIKALVFAVWSSDTVSQALINQVVYTYLISNYANVLYLAHLERFDFIQHTITLV